MHMLDLGVAAPWLVAAALGAAAAAQLSAQGRDDPIRTGIELVAVDFAALGRDGSPVADLAASQVSLRVGGRERQIKSFQFVQAVPAHSDGSPGPALGELSPPYGTNYLGEAGRAIILVLENDSLRAAVARHTIDAVSAFVGTLSPRDRVALVTTPRGGVLADLSRDHRRVRELLLKVSGLGSQRATDSEKSCRTRDTLNALRGLLEGLASVDMPKTIVFVSGGILTPRRDAPLAAPPGPCEIRAVNFEEVGRAAFETRANFYVIKVDDLVIDSAADAFADPTASRFRSSDDELAGMESLAGVTSGTLLRITPSDNAAFERVGRETSGYYLVAFEPEPGERNGLSHRLEVSIARPEVTVRARPRLTIRKPATGSTPPARTPQAMLRDGRAFRDLPLRAAAFASANRGSADLKIVALAEPLDSSAVITSAAFGLIDDRGRLVAQWTANERELAQLPIASAGLVAPGAYRLRVAAVDADGRRGAADYEFDASLTSVGPLKLSTLVLGVSRTGFVPRLQFATEPAATGFFELYGAVADSSAVKVEFELATTSESEAFIRVPGVVTRTRQPDLHRAVGVLAVGALVPGDYVVRASVSIDGKSVGQVVRTLRKSIP